MDQLTFVGAFLWENFLAIWPYLLITIPLAVGVKLSGASQYIARAFQAGPLVAIVLATAVGAFSLFCSCSVLPVVASLLIGGVPLAPVMAFWVASPSMDPEIFFLSVSMLGWELALWRLLGTLALSLAAGLLTHFFVQRGWLGADFLRHKWPVPVRGRRRLPIPLPPLPPHRLARSQRAHLQLAPLLLSSIIAPGEYQCPIRISQQATTR